jgi:hypothetical protein
VYVFDRVMWGLSPPQESPRYDRGAGSDGTVNASQASSRTLMACEQGLHALAYEWFDDSM